MLHHGLKFLSSLITLGVLYVSGEMVSWWNVCELLLPTSSCWAQLVQYMGFGSAYFKFLLTLLDLISPYYSISRGKVYHYFLVRRSWESVSSIMDVSFWGIMPTNRNAYQALIPTRQPSIATHTHTNELEVNLSTSVACDRDNPNW